MSLNRAFFIIAIFLNFLQFLDGEENKMEKVKQKKEDNFPKSYVITAAQAIQNPYSARMYGKINNAGSPNKPLLQNLEQYCKTNNSSQIIQSIRGSYVNEIEMSKFFRDREDAVMENAAFRRLCAERNRENNKREFWKEYIAKHPNSERPMPMHYFWKDIPKDEYTILDVKELNKKISVIEPQNPPQNENPATGNRDIPQDYMGVSIIMPSPKQVFTSIPKGLGGKFPKVLLTTGCCTYPNYNDTNSRGKKAKRHHQYGFVAVDILDGRTYLPRIVPALENGTFIDLGIKYAHGQEPIKIKTKALVLGDIHVPFQDYKAIQASFEMIKTLKPESIFVHDVLDFHCINHHSSGNLLWQMLLSERGLDVLENELEAGLKFLRKLSSAAPGKVYVVPSNHDQFLPRWINERLMKDPRNLRMAGKIISAYTDKENIIKTALKQVGKIPDNLEFLLLGDDQKPHNYECAAHGHLGVDGARGNLKQFKVSYGKVVIGHTHTLEVDGHSLSAGTNSMIPLEYQLGQPSKAIRGNVAIYEPGLAQAIPIIKGRWKKDK